MKVLFSCCTLALFIGLPSSPAFGLAGIAEHASYFHYNDFAVVERGHPADICSGKTKWCLALVKEKFRNFRDLDSTFEQLNVPLDHASPYVIGQRSSWDRWLVYDLKKEEVLIADKDYKKVIKVWYSLGLAKPTYVNARNTRELLTETDDSVSSRWSQNLLLWLMLSLPLLTLGTVIFLYLSWKSRRNYQQTNSKIWLAATYLFLIPVIFLIYVAISSFIELVRQHW